MIRPIGSSPPVVFRVYLNRCSCILDAIVCVVEDVITVCRCVSTDDWIGRSRAVDADGVGKDGIFENRWQCVCSIQVNAAVRVITDGVVLDQRAAVADVDAAVPIELEGAAACCNA